MGVRGVEPGIFCHIKETLLCETVATSLVKTTRDKCKTCIIINIYFSILLTENTWRQDHINAFSFLSAHSLLTYKVLPIHQASFWGQSTIILYSRGRDVGGEFSMYM